MTCAANAIGSFVEIQTTIAELQVCDIRVHGQLQSERGEKISDLKKSQLFNK